VVPASRATEVVGDRGASPPGDEDRDGPVDRRSDAHVASEQLLDDIKTGIDLVRDDIEACIEDWSEVEPDMDGQVVVRFSLDADGLQEAWIGDVEDVPAGPLTCFAAAVWEVDWADISDDPIEVSFPFEVTTGDDDPP